MEKEFTGSVLTVNSNTSAVTIVTLLVSIVVGASFIGVVVQNRVLTVELETSVKVQVIFKSFTVYTVSEPFVIVTAEIVDNI